MTATQGNLASLSRYIFRAPNWRSSVGFALLLAAVVGVAAFESAFVLDDAYRGLFYVGIPTLAAAFLTAPIDRRLGGQLTYNRSSLLALASEGIVVVMLAVAGGVAVLTPLGQRFVFDVLIEALAVIFAFRLLVVMAVSQRNPLVAAIPASVQTLTAAGLLFVYSGTLRYLEVGGPIIDVYLSRSAEAPAILSHIGPGDFELLLVTSLVYSLGVWGLVYVIDRPWRRSLGVSGFDFLRGFIGYIAEDSRELEAFFERIGERAVVPVTVLGFRRPGGREKARFVLPMIHPGPMGEIGGGNLPRRVAQLSEGLGFPPHATAGHDFNLVTERELDKVLDAAERAYGRIEYHDTATRSYRHEQGEATLLGQRFGDDLLLTVTYAPHFTDDIFYGVGTTAQAQARSSDVEEVLLVDAHNSNDGIEGMADLGHVFPGSSRSFDLIEGAGRVGDALVEAPQSPVALGTAWDETRWGLHEGIGSLGVRVAAVEVAGQTTAYVVVDGNNMEPGLRDEIVDRVDAVDELEVMTTDNHSVTSIESENQVGARIETDELVAVIDALVDEALDDLEPVEVGMASERAEVIVFGNDRTETLASHANAVLSMGGAVVGAVMLLTVTVSVAIFLLS